MYLGKKEQNRLEYYLASDFIARVIYTIYIYTASSSDARVHIEEECLCATMMMFAPLIERDENDVN